MPTLVCGKEILFSMESYVIAMNGYGELSKLISTSHYCALFI